MQLRQIKGALALAVVLLTGLASSASAAVFTGGSDDPRDAPIVVGSSGRAADVKRVGAVYDDAAGDLKVVTDFYDFISLTNFYLDARLGIPKAGVGCVPDQDDITFSEVNWGVDDGEEDIHDRHSSLEFHSSSGYTGIAYGDSVQEPNTRYTATLNGVKELVRLGVRCVSALKVTAYGFASDGTMYSTTDEVKPFCLVAGACSMPQGPENIAPAVNWVKPSDGAIISGKLSETGPTCLVNATDASGIDHVDISVDNKLYETQVNAPWGCEVDTRGFADGQHAFTAKAFDKHGNSASSSVTVTIKNTSPPPPPPLPPPPPVTPTSTPTPIETPDVEVLGTVKASRLKISTARTRTGKALAKRFGKTYRKRRSFTRACAPTSRRVVSCHVAWRYKHRAYKGKVRVRLLDSGKYRVKVSVKARRK